MSDVRALIATAEKYPPAEPDIAPPDDYVDEEAPEVRGPWQIADRGSLDWAMGRLAALEAEAQAIETQAAAAHKRIDDRRDTLLKRLSRGVLWFRFRIAEYADRNRATLLGGGKKKSADLLHGRIGWRTKGSKLVVEDKEALVSWLERQSPDLGLFRVKVEPAMAELNAYCKSANVVPPGCTIDPGSETFYVEPLSPEKGLEKP